MQETLKNIILFFVHISWSITEILPQSLNTFFPIPRCPVTNTYCPIQLHIPDHRSSKQSDHQSSWALYIFYSKQFDTSTLDDVCFKDSFSPLKNDYRMRFPIKFYLLFCVQNRACSLPYNLTLIWLLVTFISSSMLCFHFFSFCPVVLHFFWNIYCRILL